MEARAPTRIDLAGGGLDLHPLDLMLDGPLTVNFAITLHARIRLSAGDPPADLPELLAYPLRHLGIRRHVEASSQAPAGSGLGGSSALLLALLGALNVDPPDQVRSTLQLCELAARLETRVLGVPAGRQDYYAAALGGLNALWFGPGETRVEALETPLDLEGRLVLAYSGQTHSSAQANWRLLRAYVEDRGDTRERVRQLQANTLALRTALLAGDEDGFATSLANDGRLRQPWAGAATLTRLGRLAERAGALAWKPCGAGRGGCLVAWAAPGRTADVRAALGPAVLDWSADRRGLQVTVSAG